LNDSTTILIKNNLTADINVYKSYRVTSTPGLRFADIRIPLNDFIEISDIKGYTEFPKGKKIRLSQQDIGRSSAPGFRGFGGIQLVTFSLPNPVVGSILVYQYKMKIKSLLYLPKLMPRTDCATERIVVSLSWESRIKPRFDSEGFNFSSKDSLGVFSRQLEKKDMKFFADSLPEIPDEPYSCPMRYHVLFSSDNFSYGKLKFSSVSWSEVGGFFMKLSTQPEQKIADLTALASKLTRGSKSFADTVQSFFNFVADSVSYVPLQVNKGDFTPHGCDIILSRRFGDCKDQSVLLTSLCRAVGIAAFQALVSTGDMPEVSALFPWPSWFDHVVTVIRHKGEEIILDPSDKLTGINAVSPRLRGKSYLVCDGISSIETMPNGPLPSNKISWNFAINDEIDGQLNTEFELLFANDASLVFSQIFQDGKINQLGSFWETQLKAAGWDISTFNVNKMDVKPDSLLLDGVFTISPGDMGEYANVSIPSPLSTYILQNLFSDVRATDYCNHNSYLLEESIVLDNSSINIMPIGSFSDNWRRPGFEFVDELELVDGKPEFHRIFEFDGEPLSVSDYNSFRDFLLSRKDQQYVRIKK
jgi:hypothetical protein